MQMIINTITVYNKTLSDNFIGLDRRVNPSSQATLDDVLAGAAVNTILFQK